MSKSKTVWSTVVGILSSLFALLGIVSCCGLPILAGILATLGIGASQLSFFAEYRCWFIAFAIVSLLFGFYQVYFKKSGECCTTQESAATSCCCTGTSGDTGNSKSQLFQKIFLWIGAVIIGVVLLIGSNDDTAVSDSGCCPVEKVDESGCCPAAKSVETPKTPASCCPR